MKSFKQILHGLITVIRWVLGVFLLLIGLMSILSGSVVIGFFFVAFALLSIPLSSKYIFTRLARKTSAPTEKTVSTKSIKLLIIIILGGLLFLFFSVGGGLGISLNLGFIAVSLDTLIAIGLLEGILCSIIAAKKNKSLSLAFCIGFFLGLLAILYYLISKPALSEKEKEIYKWELERKYQSMLEERRGHDTTKIC